MKTKTLLLTMMILLALPLYGQDGKLVAQSPVTIDANTLAQLEKNDPSLQKKLRKIEMNEISYLSDGLKVKGFVVAPKDGGKFPCIIYNRGGSKDFGDITPEIVATRLAKIASWGYVVVASRYRGNGGGEGKEEFGGSDVNDILSLIPLLSALPKADASRIGMYGRSRGGMMTYLALTRTDRVAAAIVDAGLADAFDTLARRPAMEKNWSELIPNYEQNKHTVLKARSAVQWPEKLHKKTPILLLHGTADWRVNPTEALRMAAALYENKHPFRFVLFEGGDHALTEHRDEADRLIKDWLDNYVRDKKAWPSLEPHGN